MKTNNITVAFGQIQFFDSIQPPLESGAYTLSAVHEILDIPAQTVDPYKSDQLINIDGPRFVLNPAQIHTLYPPAGQSGLFDNVLPNIVFNNFSLPWSRPIDPVAQVKGDADGNDIPWMGLLTLYPDDMPDENGKGKVGIPQTIQVSDLAKPDDPTILPPALGNLFGMDNEKVSVVDVDLPFFLSVSPKLEELPFLAHGRAVNTAGKVLLGMDDDGCFSLVVGNRLPKANAKNTVYLVSYEGHQDHLRGNKINGNYTRIRLVLLGSWQFTASASQGSFIQLMENLCMDGRGGVKLLQMPGDIAAAAKEAIEIGYVPIQNNMREGEVSTSWYRGPLMPAPTKRDFAYGPYHYSDHAIHYDPATGIFNHAYSAAWQIGRLLALSDGSFSNALFSWRNNYLKKAMDSVKSISIEKMRVIAGVKDDAIPENMLDTMQQLFTGGFSKVTWPQVKIRSSVVLGEHLPGILTPDEKAAIIQNDEDPLLALTQKIKGDKL